MSSPAYQLIVPPPPVAAPLSADAAQRRVTEHPGGPLLVLAGPGTGKTTTLVEAVCRRVEQGADLDRLLVLTFSRRSAQELRDRISTRLGRTTAGPAAWTFHAWCYALLRSTQSPDAFTEPLRLLSGPQQDVTLRELLVGTLAVGRPRWPQELRAALTRRGMAEEVRALFSRARELGLGPAELAALAQREHRGDWAALATFFGEYLDILDAMGAIDYAELVARAAVIAETPLGAQLRDRYDAVFVDEYQDTDPAQERLLQVVAGSGRDLVVVGDPDQSIYAFRGAQVEGLLEFPDRFRQANGTPAPVVALQTCRRCPVPVIEASRQVAARIPAPGLPVPALRAHRALRPADGADPDAPPVVAVTYPTAGAEAAAIADVLRREHLEDGTPWERMAVLVRSGTRSLPPLRRALGAAGVPVEVAGDELPLAREPAVIPLLTALRVAAAPAQDPTELTEEIARELLVGPLGRADPAALRRIGRLLRDRETGPLPRSSARLIRDAVADPRLLKGIPEQTARPVLRLARLLADARKELKVEGGAQEALWLLWERSGWARRLEQDSLAGGPAARAADRDLDAVVALFSAVGRASEQRRHVAGVGPLVDELEAQQIPGDTLAERSARGGAVRLLTAHRSKGLEWDVVVVAGVQEGVWPDLRSRSSLLSSERLERPEAGVLREPVSKGQLLVDERRLFYVACTRARRRLIVTAVASNDEDGERPSRFLTELGVEVRAVRERPARPLALAAVVAQLRRLAIDPAASAGTRAAAAARLARLAAQEDAAGRRLVPAAHPDSWWGLVPLSPGARPVLQPGQVLRLSGTSLRALEECPLRWFLEHEAKAQGGSTVAMGFGSVVHAIADEVAHGKCAPEIGAMMQRLDTVWQELAFEAPWESALSREAARSALERYLIWQDGVRGRKMLASERKFEITVTIEDVPIRLRGTVDRLEIDADGALHVVDFKTSKSAVGAGDLKAHPQLGLYQLAAQRGAFADVVSTDVPVGGAELVQLRIDAQRGNPAPKVQTQDALPEGDNWLTEMLGNAVRRIGAEDFGPQPDDHCKWCRFKRCCPAQPEGRQVVS